MFKDVWGLTNKTQQQLQLAAWFVCSLEAEDIMIWPSAATSEICGAPVVAFQHRNRFLHIPPDVSLEQTWTTIFRGDCGGVLPDLHLLSSVAGPAKDQVPSCRAMRKRTSMWSERRYESLSWQGHMGAGTKVISWTAFLRFRSQSNRRAQKLCSCGTFLFFLCTKLKSVSWNRNHCPETRTIQLLGST